MEPSGSLPVTDAVVPSVMRRSHRKTRTGCTACKARKVKCDERKPICRRCAYRSLECVYQVKPTPLASGGPSEEDSPRTLRSLETENLSIQSATSSSKTAGSPRNGDLVSDINKLHLELIHNFTTSTSLTLNSDATIRNLWRLNVPRLALEFDFVMYAVLALSALHLARFSPERYEYLVAQAAILHQNGLRLATTVLPHVTPENCTGIYIFTALTCLITLASPRKPEDILLVKDTGISEWLLHFRGTRSVMNTSRDIILSGPMGPLLLAGRQRRTMMAEVAIKQTMETDQLENLENLVRESVTDPSHVHIYAGAIFELRGSFNIVYAPGFQGYESADVFLWLFEISDEYLNLLKERRQESLAIFAFYCVILKRFDPCWYINVRLRSQYGVKRRHILIKLETAASSEMDIFDELENLARTAAYDEPGDGGDIHYANRRIIKMWQDRFGYTYEEAVRIIRATQTATKTFTSSWKAILSPAEARALYLLKLDGLISTPQKVQVAANLTNIPESHLGSSDSRDSVFCKVDGRAKIFIENWLSMQKGPVFRPLFIPVRMAYKELSSQSLYPRLGKDTTLPQFRPQDPHFLSAPPSFGRTQYEFPVWYFFYGTLASIPKLCTLLSLPDDDVPILYEASVIGGTMGT
ncbi:hypothetical protein V495_00243 [Pseudogymnoascus sp. VKM F-4514 (FW-929)]|nr:hypothetical protein V495_00243 [Pseudogymnoascus sp. VKM F-4514 (FW-929)]KFY67107.1 hypothetical protein V497_00536 [Pseudogymnoascus sp. VKM F-4516 (FW-969)]